MAIAVTTIEFGEDLQIMQSIFEQLGLMGNRH